MSKPSSPELAVVIPVYNEEAVIGQVLADWDGHLAGLGMDYAIHAYNDGSRDNSLQAMQAEAAKRPRVHVHDKANSGHGPTILRGYRENSGAQWLFQVDSDNEMDPAGFAELWNRREDHDFLLGYRKDRASSVGRAFISLVSRLTVRVLFGRSIWDVNSPFRLMRNECFRDLMLAIPDDTFAPNIIVSGAAASRNLRCYETAAPYRVRQTGVVSITGFKLIRNTIKAFFQVAMFRFAHGRIIRHNPCGP